MHDDSSLRRRSTSSVVLAHYVTQGSDRVRRCPAIGADTCNRCDGYGPRQKEKTVGTVQPQGGVIQLRRPGKRFGTYVTPRRFHIRAGRD